MQAPGGGSTVVGPSVIHLLAKSNESLWVQMGNFAEKLGESDRACAHYEAALRNNPNSIPALTQIAGLCRVKEQFPKAIEHFQRILNIDNTNGEIWGAIGHCNLMMDDLQKAYNAYQQALYHLRNPKEPKLWYGIGILYDRYGSFEHAEEAFTSVINMDPDFEKANEIYFRLGIIYKQQQKYDLSLDCFRYILTNPPKPLTELDIWFQIGHVYEQKKDFDPAKEAYERVLAENPEHAKVLQQLGWLYHQENSGFANQDTAISFLKRSLESDINDAQTWYLLGRGYMAQQKFIKAYDAYQQAVYRDGRNPTFWCSIGVLYYKINQYPDALDAYTRAIHLNPYISEVWYDLGTLYESCNNQLSDALDAYNQALELDPTNAHIKQTIENLKRQQGNKVQSSAPSVIQNSVKPDPKAAGTAPGGSNGVHHIYHVSFHNLISQGPQGPPNFQSALNGGTVSSGSVSLPQPPQMQVLIQAITDKDGTDGRTMIQCDYCDDWFHLECLKDHGIPDITEDDLPFYIKFHCEQCIPIRGESVFRPPTRKSAREKVNKNYLDLHNGKGVSSKWSRLIESKTNFIRHHKFHRFPNGYNLTKDWIESTGFHTPCIVEDPEGLGMRMPPSELTVSDVADACGRDTVVEVLYVPTQSERRMTLDEWAQYFEQPEGLRSGILNVITLEISDSPLGKLVKRPQVVCDIDWTDHIWPAHLKPEKYPKVQLYCLMSVKDSYTDFHVDFGGSSVFYHVLSGQKIFYFIEPTPTNLKKYSEWSTSANQSSIFFANNVTHCYEVRLKAGNTMLIPTGWIHAVYTPADSMVIGGNFLHGYNIEGQLSIYEIENKANVDQKFRFPYYQMMLWYAARYYLRVLKDDPDTLTDLTLAGLLELAKFLHDLALKASDVSNVSKNARRLIRDNIPPGTRNVQKLARSFKRSAKAERRDRRNAKNFDLQECCSNAKLEVDPTPAPIIIIDNPLINPDISTAVKESSPIIRFRMIEAIPAEIADKTEPTLVIGNEENIVKLKSPDLESLNTESEDEWDSDLTEMEAFDSDESYEDLIVNEKSETKLPRSIIKPPPPAQEVYAREVPVVSISRALPIVAKRIVKKQHQGRKPVSKKPRLDEKWVIPNHSVQNMEAAVLDSKDSMSSVAKDAAPVRAIKDIVVTVKKMPLKGNCGAKLFEKLKKGLK